MKAWRWVIPPVLLWMGLSSLRALAVDKPVHKIENGKKKTIVYRSHTQLDFSGETVQGKVRAPEVFYIFQRKRSGAHHIVQTPTSFEYQQGRMRDALIGAIPK